MASDEHVIGPMAARLSDAQSCRADLAVGAHRIERRDPPDRELQEGMLVVFTQTSSALNDLYSLRAGPGSNDVVPAGSATGQRVTAARRHPERDQRGT
jgi:hypothetical protein